MNERDVKTGEQDEIARRVKGQEQALRNMQGTRGPTNVSYKKLVFVPQRPATCGIQDAKV